LPETDRLLGVVEGFYGQPWRWSERRAYAGYLRDLGLNTFLYAPKADAYLRKRWRESWPVSERQELALTAREYRRSGLRWGVGLSPYALYANYRGEAKQALRNKVLEIEDTGCNLLALLFDDMPGHSADLAAVQAEIVADVRRWSSSGSVLLCPTYYSLDPALEKHFGPRPPDYWAELGRLVDPQVQIFWTGNNVVSSTISSADLVAITAQLRRRPVLWDNYPVNDGAAMVEYLHLAPLAGRSPDLPAATAGHLCNPMNQPQLSRYPLGGLAALYGGVAPPLASIYSKRLARLLSRDQARFQYEGLGKLDQQQREVLIAEYSECDDDAAREVVDWLKGRYAFDPDCLTG
jgi:hypothetical protein